MTAITTRAGKGSPLTNVEVDANFTNLNNDKLEKTGGTITANSTDPALKITQTGSGDALRVEDASGDTTPFVIDQNGNVGVGVSTAFANNKLSVSGGTDASTWLVRSSADNTGYEVRLLKNRNTNVYANTVVNSSDVLGAVSFGGNDGTNYQLGASIQALVDGTPGTNDMPGRLVFSTTADGASSPTERMRIDASGSVGIGGTPDYKLDVFSGSIRVNGNARTVAGDASIYFGSTTSNYIYSGNSSNIMAFATNGAERLRIDSAGNVGIGSTPKTRLQVTAAANLNTPVLGSATNAPFYVTNSDASYGLLVGINAADGSAWMQVQRTDGTATAYDLKLQPAGGNTLHVGSNGGLGYGTGAGGTVTQATSKSTAVTLNKPCGHIQMANESLASGSTASFIVNNSLMNQSDCVFVNTLTYGSYQAWAESAVGSFRVYLKNVTGVSLAEAVVINFAIIKGAVA